MNKRCYLKKSKNKCENEIIASCSQYWINKQFKILLKQFESCEY